MISLMPGVIADLKHAIEIKYLDSFGAFRIFPIKGL